MSANLRKAEEEPGSMRTSVLSALGTAHALQLQSFLHVSLPGINMDMVMAAYKADSVAPATYKGSINVI